MINTIRENYLNKLVFVNTSIHIIPLFVLKPTSFTFQTILYNFYKKIKKFLKKIPMEDKLHLVELMNFKNTRKKY